MFSSRTGSSALCASEKSAEEKDTAAGDEVAMGGGGDRSPFSLGRQGGECGLREEREAEHDGGVDPAQF